MNVVKRVLAFDIGASSGRAMLGEFDGEIINLKEVHRFSNDSINVGGEMYWDTLRLFYEIKQGMVKAKFAGGYQSIAIDTWGVDFALLTKEGRLLENSIHYRDARTAGMLEKAFSKISKDRLYQITGNQIMEINTAFQLLSLVENRPELLERAKTLLMTPDLFNYFLTGVKKTEYSIASTSQLMDAKKKNWSKKVIGALGISEDIFTEIIPTGTVVGKLSSAICEELDLEPINVIAVASHDTQSALVAVPTEKKDFIFLSSGTWSLIGTELDEPIINEESLKNEITNEGGYGFKTTFLKNITGTWLIQESRRQWIREGKEYSFGELEIMAKKIQSFNCFIDPDAPEFIAPGNIPKRIYKYCVRTGQTPPHSVAEIVRCIDESLAMKYNNALKSIEKCTKKEYTTIHIVGGGVQSKLLSQMTANACNCNVIAGPIEATVFGNIAVQFIANGIIENLKTARKVISKSTEMYCYEPQEISDWKEAYRRYLRIIQMV